MRNETPTACVLGHSFDLFDPHGHSPAMQSVSECVSSIRPEIVRHGEIFGDRQVMWTLIAVVIDTALETGDEEIVAAMLHTNARLLELEHEGKRKR